MDPFEMYGSLFWGVLFLGAGTVGLPYANRHLRYAKASPGWKKIDAEITELALRVNTGRNGSRYFPIVSYMYQHDGRWITGERIAFFETPYPSREDAEDVLARYAQGTRVTVSVAPHDPELSVLEAGARSSHYLPRFFALGLIIVGAFFLASVGIAMVGAR